MTVVIISIILVWLICSWIFTLIYLLHLCLLSVPTSITGFCLPTWPYQSLLFDAILTMSLVAVYLPFAVMNSNKFAHLLLQIFSRRLCTKDTWPSWNRGDLLPIVHKQGGPFGNVQAAMSVFFFKGRATNAARYRLFTGFHALLLFSNKLCSSFTGGNQKRCNGAILVAFMLLGTWCNVKLLFEWRIRTPLTVANSFLNLNFPFH